MKFILKRASEASLDNEYPWDFTPPHIKRYDDNGNYSNEFIAWRKTIIFEKEINITKWIELEQLISEYPEGLIIKDGTITIYDDYYE